MKLWIVITFVLAGCYACSDNNKQEIAPAQEWGVDSTYIAINDSIWPSNAVRVNSTNDTLLSISIDIKKTLSDGTQYSYENLYFKMVRKGMHLQKFDSVGFFSANIITKPTAFFFTKIDVDALNETFVIYRPDSLNNWIQITEQKDDFKKISGRFNITLIKSQEGIEYRYPDTIRIRNGYFRVTMKE